MKKAAKIWLLILMFLASGIPIFAADSQFADAEKNIPLHWRTETISIAFSNSLKNAPNIRPNSDVSGALKRSLAHWERETNIKFTISWTDKQSISNDGKGDGINLVTIAQTPENIAIFSQDGSETAANTRNFYTRRGEILEADIALSPFQQFSTDGSFDTFDLESVMTHEIGHFLGLDHSAVIGSTMAENQSKNGMFGLPDFVPRTLAEDDKSAIRALYGAKIENETCCGTVAGKVLGSEGKPLANELLWAEELSSGKVFASANLRRDGSFQIGGLPPGKYRILAQSRNSEDDKNLNSFSTEELGEVTVEIDKTTPLVRRIKTQKTQFSALRIGFNAQLSMVAVPLNAGKTYQLFVSGENMELADLQNSAINSPFFTITPNSIRKEDFSTEDTVLSFEITIAPNAPNGEYSLHLQKTNGETIYLVGALTIDALKNDFQSHLFFEE